MKYVPDTLRISLRKLVRERLYAFINLAGLSLAVACCLVLALYLQSELSYDRHFDGHENIYRIVEEFNNKGQLDAFARTGSTLGYLMKQDFVEVEDYVAFNAMPPLMLRHEDDGVFWDTVYTVTSNIFDVFSHDFIYGDGATALSQPGSAAVSESFARRYFGAENPIGRIVNSELGQVLTISAVFADLPENTHLKYDVLIPGIPTDTAPGNVLQQRQRLWQTPYFTYLVMADGFDADEFDGIASQFYDRHMAAIGEPQGMSMRFWLEPLAGIHLQSNVQRDLPGGSPAYVYAFTAVAFFILVIACINYMNLATARSMRRSREVGMFKILGARRGQLIWQFILEAMVFAILATVIGIAIVEVVLDMTDLNQMLGKSLDLRVADQPEVLAALVLFCLVMGLSAGLYPAFYLSSFAPVSALVSDKSSGRSGAGLRYGLVLVQFTVSIAVVAGTLLMAKQMRYLSEIGLGFERENRVVIELVGADVIRKLPVIKAELLQHPGIISASAHDGNLGTLENMGAMPVETRDGAMDAITINLSQVDEDFFDTMGVSLVSGRDFSRRLLTDIGRSVIVNEALVRTMGWDEPLGKRLRDGRVIGVMQDFHFQSLHDVIDPLAFILFEDNWEAAPPASQALARRNLTLNIAGENIRETLDYLEQRFAEFDPSHPFTFEFLDESLDALYRSDENMMKLIGLFAGICIFIACLGLFGLSSYATEQRNKEIGIRKVLGATTAQIIGMLSRRVLILVCAGGLLACVIAYLAIDRWLLDFAYRTDIGVSAFVLAVTAALAVAYLTVAAQSFRTARADPVDALRYE